MKIGILTFQYGVNFGGVLQCVALQNVLKDMGHDVQIINYVPLTFNYYKYYQPSFYYLRNIKSVSHYLISIKYKLLQYRQISKFEKFRKKYLTRTARLDESSINSIRNNYDVVIVGSDQVWGPFQHNYKAFFLDFEMGNTRRISYAPCCAKNDVAAENTDRLKNALLKFDYISVRNNETYNFVKDLTNKPSFIAADPTILYNFNEMVTNNNPYGEDYVMVYVIGKDLVGGNNNAIIKIRNKYPNHKIYAVLLYQQNPCYFKWADKVFYDLDPSEWVNMIANSGFLYTDSFHGVVFALKFRKQFIAYYVDKLRASRFIDLKHRYNIEDFIVESVAEIDEKQSLNKQPDYTHINNVLNNQKKESITFLNKSISGTT